MANFVPIGDYEWPSMPTEHALRRFWMRLKQQVQRDDADPVRAEDRLQRATLRTLDEVAGPPACGPLLDELGSSLKDWIADPKPLSWLEVVVMPPCDRNDIVATWAEGEGHRIVEPPPRHRLIERDRALQSIPGDIDIDIETRGEGLIVLPRLEAWFLRHRNGLGAVRALLARLALLERHCLIGCNSFAWAFLVKSVGAAVALPKARTFVAFDAPRLHDWFSVLSDDDATQRITFRMARSGEDVLAKNAEGEPESTYLKQLAARSLGIPWVAWHLWRQSIRSSADDEEVSEKAQQATDGDERTLWLADIDELALPLGHEEAALLVLQALLIHDTLSLAELAGVLPASGGPDIVAALIRAGFVDRDGERLQARPAAYPRVREALKADGFPVDVL